MDSAGTLFVVATPIGNLADITLRAIEVLKNVDIIAAEGVNRTRVLCRHYGIKTVVKRFDQHNQRRRLPELLSSLKSGRRVALVSNAGTPGISDPGAFLVSKALAEGIKVTPVPGPSAVAAALSVSGTGAEQFVFLGFPPAKKGARRKEFQRWSTAEIPIVIYEAPHRIKNTLTDIKEVFLDPEVVLFKELTKIHEEVRRGKANEILTSLTEDEVRGEFVLVVEPRVASTEKDLGEDVLRKLEQMVAEGAKSLKDIAREISGQTGIPFRKIYKISLEMKRNRPGMV